MVLLEEDNLEKKANKILKQMTSDLKMLEVKDQIENKVRVDIEKQQRDYYLNQQLKTIQDELGQNPQEEDVKALIERAKNRKFNAACRSSNVPTCCRFWMYPVK